MSAFNVVELWLVDPDDEFGENDQFLMRMTVPIPEDRMLHIRLPDPESPPGTGSQKKPLRFAEHATSNGY